MALQPLIVTMVWLITFTMTLALTLSIIFSPKFHITTWLKRYLILYNPISHNTQYIHNIFLIPECYSFYSLQTQAAKPVLGEYYREPEKSGPVPFHLMKYLLQSIGSDHFVSDTGDIVYYQTDDQLHKYTWTKSEWHFGALFDTSHSKYLLLMLLYWGVTWVHASWAHDFIFSFTINGSSW